MTQYDVILPAGGRIDAEFAAKVGTERKALIQFGPETILERTIRCLHETGCFDRVVLIGSEEVTKSPSAARATLTLPEGASGPDNILAGLKALEANGGTGKKVVICTTDLPFLTPQVMHEFLDRSPKDLDIVIPLCTQTDYQKRFPNSSSTFIRLRDEAWTAGGMYLMEPAALLKAMPMINRLFANRKSKIGMARLLGPMLLYKYLSKTLTIDDVQRKALALLGLRGAGMPDAPPELAYDIDYFDDYEYALTRLAP